MVVATNLYINKVTAPVLSIKADLLLPNSSTNFVITSGVFLNGTLYAGNGYSPIGIVAINPATMTVIASNNNLPALPYSTDGTILYGILFNSQGAPTDVVSIDPATLTVITSVPLPASYTFLAFPYSSILYRKGMLYVIYNNTSNTSQSIAYAYSTPNLSVVAQSPVIDGEYASITSRGSYLYITTTIATKTKGTTTVYKLTPELVQVEAGTFGFGGDITATL